MAKFSDTLKMKGNQVEPPKVLPTGNYIFVITGLPKTVDDRKDKAGEPMTILEFPVKPIAPGPDVNISDLQEAGGLDGKGTKFSQFVTSESNQYYFIQWMKNVLGLNDSMSIGEMIAQTPGKQFMGKVVHVTNNGRILANIGDTAKA